MVHPASAFCIWLSVIGTICTVVCLVECGKCPREGKPECCSASTFVQGCNGLQNSYISYLGLDHLSGNQGTVFFDDNACHSSESVPFPSTTFGFLSEQQSLSSSLDIDKSDSGVALHKQSIKSDGNISWALDDVVFRVPNGRTVICSLNFREYESFSSVSGANQTASSCRQHLLHNKGTSYSLWNINLENSQSSDSSSPHVNITPSKLDWGQNYLFHSSLVSLSLKNTCNESVITVYEPFSTNSQFYPFDFSEVVLGPGDVTTITFAYLPSVLGLSSAELVLHTSFGGFLVEAKGFAVDSPYSLRPLVDLDAFSGGWLTKTLSLSNPFDETIDLEEVAALISVPESTGSSLVNVICKKQSHDYSNRGSPSHVHKVSEGHSGQLDSMVMAVRPLSDWLITPHRTQSVLEMTFSPNPEGNVIGAVCMELIRTQEGERDTLVVPFEAELKKTAAWKDTASSLSVSIEAIGPCDASETSISISVGNMASHLLKLVKIEEVNSKKLLQIKYLEGLLLFPGSVSEVALVTYDPSNVMYNSFPEPDISISCKLKILVNDSVSPLLDVPCLDFIGIGPCQHQESLCCMPDIFNPSFRMKSPGLTKAPMRAKADDYVHKEWKVQSTVSRNLLLDNNELFFPLVPIGKYYAQSITVRNPSQQPVIVQLILNSQETVDNCQTCYGHQKSPSPSSSICSDSGRVNMHGFSVADSAVTEVFLHPLHTASLGPILFHPSNRCEWKSSAFIRSNLSGLELLSLQGFGGALSLVMLEGSELMQRLDFNVNLPFPLNESYIENASSVCRRPLLKKLFAVNAGDFPVDVKRIDVSGRECGLDGFVVHHCRPFTLEPGESSELGLSYQSDFSLPVVRRELEFILGVGILVIPIQASIPLSTLNLCGNSIFWEVSKKYFWFIIMIAILISLIWFTMLPHPMDHLIKGEKNSIDNGMAEGKPSSILFHNQGNGRPIRPTQPGNMKPEIVAEHTDRSLDCQTKITPASDSKEVNFSPLPSESLPVKKADKFEVAQPVHLTVKTRNEKRRRSRRRNALIEVSSSQSGNSTPSSPLSPNTTLSPPETCSLSQEKMEPHDSYSPKPVVALSEGAPENQIKNLISTQQEASPADLRKAGNLALPSPSATYPVTRLSPSRCAITPETRAPGPKIRPQKAVQPEESSRAEEDRYAYDIWGNHLSGLHLCKPNSSVVMNSGGVGCSNSFFLRGPRQTLMTNCQPPSVSSFCDKG